MKLDPRTKLVMIICITSLALIYNTPGRLLLLFTGTIILLLVFRINLGGVWGIFKKFLPLLLTLFLVQVIFLPGGQVLVSVGSLSLITSQGLAAGASVVLRIGIVSIVAVLLTTTTSSRDFISGLVQAKVPYEIAFMVSITMRFLPLFRDEMNNIITAVQLRGVELKKVPWREKIGLFRSLFFPVVYGATLKAQQLAVAMEARCFRVYPRRTYLRRLKLTVIDYGLMLVFLTSTLMLSSM